MQDTAAADITIGSRVSYEDMANPLREGTIVGEAGGQWAVVWEERGEPTLEQDGLRFHTTVTKHMLATAVERQSKFRTEGRGYRCGGWDAAPVEPAPVELPRVYFAVPSHYTIGSEHETWAEAVDVARSKITKHDGIPGYSRAWVDVRVQDEQGDRSVHRIEIFRAPSSSAVEDGDAVELPEPSECAECGHLHWHGPKHGYSECPIDLCGCKGQPERETPPVSSRDLLRATTSRLLAEGAEPITEKPSAYVLLQRLAKAISESEIGKAYGAAEGITVWGAAEHTRFSGHETTAPAICWEEGPYEWAVVFTGDEGRNLSSEYGGCNTDDATRAAYKAVTDAGYYFELTNSFVLAVFPV